MLLPLGRLNAAGARQIILGGGNSFGIELAQRG
jgi:hypothetical protein